MSTSAPMNASHPTIYPSDGLRVLQMIVTVAIFIVGVSLNGLVVWALGVRVLSRNKGECGKTQSADSFRIYVVNLALADLVLLLRTPLMLDYLANNFTWTLGEPVCKLVIYLRCLGLYASAFLLCAVAVERCLCLLRPVWARLKRPRWAVPVACACIWVLAAALAGPYIGTAKLIPWENRTACIESDMGIGQALVVVETVAGFLLPLVIFLSCNIAVVFCAKKAESTVSSPTSSSGPSYTSQRLTRLYRVLFLTMLLFLTCWVPYFTCRFIRALTFDRPDWEKVREGAIGGAYVALFLVYIKSALNPVMYVFAARGLGRTVRASLLSTIERVFNEELSESIRRKSLRRRDSQF
ncbi:C3a anaphylatoxin chemotactic receptor [Pimephales promelas]|uniref:C3a anaphylatoxin chemotactic receptor n=1 Tax=Pimephales promelas TaxID=90988 RepID=UPI001955D04E|nr:C3a anaphylatoxin chemotactic receptor [Pimephales promelas]XP_039551105.1 C3a anaphylatoxin chemotactic receptor [Pimephales promelas]XP_039551106.1 C3a anaphylatoxin chemotactic receptor [Pimephales promelas]KAG1939246.1 G-protein coupled receptor [Pimephales promelas]